MDPPPITDTRTNVANTSDSPEPRLDEPARKYMLLRSGGGNSSQQCVPSRQVQNETTSECGAVDDSYCHKKFEYKALNKSSSDLPTEENSTEVDNKSNSNKEMKKKAEKKSSVKETTETTPEVPEPRPKRKSAENAQSMLEIYKKNYYYH